MRIIGDVHGKMEHYLHLIEDVPFSIQLGDMGFSEHYDELLKNVDPTRHRFIPGNHDDYPNLPPHALGDYGMISLGDFRAFIVRGAFSIDRLRRTEGVNWWLNEELSLLEGSLCLDAYIKAKPRIVLSHEAPSLLYPLYSRTRTGELLQFMLEGHRPDLWVFGHHHQSRDQYHLGVRFVCLDELEAVDVH